MRGRFPWLLTLASAMLFAGLMALGVWQVQRLQWKSGLIAEAEAAAARPPEPLADVIGDGGAVEFRRVVVACPGLATAPYVELQSIEDGRAGVRLISTCATEGRAGPVTYLIDRGFVADIVSARPPVSASVQPTAVTAVIRETPPPGPMAAAASGRHFYARDTGAMARVLGVEGAVAPQTLFAVTSSNPEWAALEPSAPPAAFSNNHLGYAITWFGLALALVGFYIALLRRRSTGAAPAKDPS